jgi:hypothetical protein
VKEPSGTVFDAGGYFPSGLSFSAVVKRGKCHGLGFAGTLMPE